MTITDGRADTARGIGAARPLRMIWAKLGLECRLECR